MNRRMLFFAATLVAPALSGAQAPADDSSDAKLGAVRAAIQTHGAGWVAGETPLSRLTMDQRRMRLGLSFAPMAAPALPAPTQAAAGILPKHWDWREQHAVSGVRDQKPAVPAGRSR